jgi:hypothetical protein
MTIFVSIAAYRDLVLGFTMERALAAARAPDEIHFGVIDQTDTPLIKPPANYQVIAPEAARGPCWARARAMTFYRGEDWFLQLDSHMDFDPGWDARLISEARELGPKAVLSSYPRPFVFEDRRPVHLVTPHQAQVCAVMQGNGFESAGPILKFHAYDVDVEQPVRAIHLGAGCLFAAGAFVRAFPYDPNLYFHGEEQSVFLRLYTHGWDVFHLPGMPIYHLYSDRPTGMEPRRLALGCDRRGEAQDQMDGARSNDPEAIERSGLGAADRRLRTGQGAHAGRLRGVLGHRLREPHHRAAGLLAPHGHPCVRATSSAIQAVNSKPARISSAPRFWCG